MHAELIYRRKLREFTDNLVDEGISFVSEDVLKRYCDQQDIDELVALYAESTSRYQKQDILEDSVNGDAGALLMQFMKFGKQEEKQGVALALAEGMCEKVKAALMLSIIDDINFELPYKEDERARSAHLEASLSFSSYA
jgi:hypothetical protein